MFPFLSLIILFFYLSYGLAFCSPQEHITFSKENVSSLTARGFNQYFTTELELCNTQRFSLISRRPQFLLASLYSHTRLVEMGASGLGQQKISALQLLWFTVDVHFTQRCPCTRSWVQGRTGLCDCAAGNGGVVVHGWAKYVCTGWNWMLRLWGCQNTCPFPML
jgi:hypothetical protein